MPTFILRCIKASTFLSLLAISVTSQAKPIERIEPLFWWTGMANPQVQLMVYGQNIGQSKVSVNYPGVTLIKAEVVDNPNYLFITLNIAQQTAPGKLTLQFSPLPKGESIDYLYELKNREAGSAQRQGFNQMDAIYLVVPDRFVNGDPSNDASNETLELPQRNEPGGRHGGDIQGLTEALPYIQDMGFTQIWSTPLTENNGENYSYHGYAATDLYHIDPRFGSNEGYRNFVQAAKNKGIGVIKDIVLNHIGSNHWWMKDLPDANWINNKGKFTPTNHARNTVQDPYSSKVDKTAFVSGWFVPTMPDLNQKHPLLATYLIQNSIWWIEYAGLSGIREDTYSYADKGFLSEWANRILAEYPKFTMVGEEWSANPLVVSYWQRGKKNNDGYQGSMPSMMDFPTYYALLAALNEGENWDSGWLKLYESLANDVSYPAPSKLVLFESNHDTARLFSLLENNYAKFAKAMILMATLPRIPQFFYGTEVLMQSPKERNDGIVRSDFPGGWAGDSINAFTGEGLSPEQKDAQQLIKTLLNYRKTSDIISAGTMTHFFPENEIYSYVRTAKDGDQNKQLWVFLSKNPEALQLDVIRYNELSPENCLFNDVLNGQQYEDLTAVTIPAKGWMMLECQLR
jgi:neopullulanase